MKPFSTLILLGTLLWPASARAELPWQFNQHTRYVALGDSLAAGYGAIPTTEGYVYLLYRSGVFDTITDTVFANTGIPGMTSGQVLLYQVPQAIEYLKDFQTPDAVPTFITLTVGGNDLISVLNGADPQLVLTQFAGNLIAILRQLRSALPQTRIYLSNLYTVPEIPGADQLVPYLNEMVLKPIAESFRVPVADVYSAFLGKDGLLLITRHDSERFEVHPTNAGHRAIARAFEAVIR
jgi:lysophospholipase L1-like esterase